MPCLFHLKAAHSCNRLSVQLRTGNIRNFHPLVYIGHTPRLQGVFSEVVDGNDFIRFGQRYQLIVKADNAACSAFHARNIIELLESRNVLFVRIGVFFDFDGIKRSVTCPINSYILLYTNKKITQQQDILCTSLNGRNLLNEKRNLKKWIINSSLSYFVINFYDKTKIMWYLYSRVRMGKVF